MIGAGVAGVTCSWHLKTHGFHPTIFEKSRGIGGRLATRRMDDGVAFDHGAQFITARSAAFQRTVDQALETGTAECWHPRSRNGPDAKAADWIVGTPAMNAMIKPLALGIDIRLSTEVTTIEREGDGWHVRADSGVADEVFDAVICTAPAPQARVMLASEPTMVNALAGVAIAPCWALMFTLAASFDSGFDVMRAESDDLAWIARNGSKPGRRPENDCWVAHASPQWSQAFLEYDRDDVAKRMIEMLPRAFGRVPEIDFAIAHRWRYALTTAPLGKPYVCSDDRTLFVGGDWCLGARVEFAFESGQEIANALISALKA